VQREFAGSPPPTGRCATPGAPTYFAREVQSNIRYDPRMNPSAGKWFAVSALALLIISNCGLLSRRVKVGEEFTLKPGEKVSVTGADLTIKLKAVGHQWYSDRRADSPYVELELSDVGAFGKELTLSDTQTVGNYNIKLVGANPFSGNGGPDCRLIVSRR